MVSVRYVENVDSVLDTFTLFWHLTGRLSYASSMYNRLFILLIQEGYLGIEVSPTSLPQWFTLLFLLIFIMYKHITPNTIYYHSHTFSLMIYNFNIMYTA